MVYVTPFRGWFGGVCTRVGSTYVWEWAPRGFIVSVISFLVYFDKQVHKKTGKKKQAKKIKTLNFAESNAHRKTNARGSFET